MSDTASTDWSAIGLDYGPGKNAFTSVPARGGNAPVKLPPKE